MEVNVKKAVLPSSDLPPVNKDNEYAYRYRIVSEDRNRTSSWSPIKIIPAPEVTMVDGDVTVSGASNNVITVTWSNENNRSNYDIFTKFYFFINKSSLTINKATVHTTIDHNFSIGDTIIIEGVSSVFNGTHVITDITDDTVSFDKTNTNVPQYNVSPNGTIGFDYFCHGTTPFYTYSFVKRPGSRLTIGVQVESVPIDGAKRFYGVLPKTLLQPDGNALLVYTEDISL